MTLTPRPIIIDPRANILLVKMSSMGDVIHALPALCHLRASLPLARLSWLVDARFQPLLAGHPALDEVIAAPSPGWINRVPIRSDIPRGAVQFRVATDLRRRRFDVAIDLQGLLRSAILARSTGASICVGPADAREGAPLLYRPKLSRRSGQHAVLENLALIEAVVGPCSQIRFDLSASIGSRSRADQLLGEGPIGSTAPFALIAPKSSRPIKDWPLERFTEVVRDLWHRHRLASLLVGGPREAQACQTILRRVGTPAQLCLGRPLNVLVALIKRSELVIGLDSGPVHLAAALNKRVVAILGPTDPARFAPFGFESLVAENRSDCLACRSKRSRLVPPRRHTCLVDLPAGAVLNRVQDALGRRAA